MTKLNKKKIEAMMQSSMNEMLLLQGNNQFDTECKEYAMELFLEQVSKEMPIERFKEVVDEAYRKKHAWKYM